MKYVSITLTHISSTRRANATLRMVARTSVTVGAQLKLSSTRPVLKPRRSTSVQQHQRISRRNTRFPHSKPRLSASMVNSDGVTPTLRITLAPLTQRRMITASQRLISVLTSAILRVKRSMVSTSSLRRVKRWFASKTLPSQLVMRKCSETPVEQATSLRLEREYLEP